MIVFLIDSDFPLLFPPPDALLNPFSQGFSSLKKINQLNIKVKAPKIDDTFYWCLSRRLNRFIGAYHAA